MKAKDFFNKMPCIVDMAVMKGPHTITEEDTIVCVELDKKDTYPYYTVYYLHRIYNDDRIYKCALRMRTLPDLVRAWCNRRFPSDNTMRTRWEGEEETKQLRFNMEV